MLYDPNRGLLVPPDLDDRTWSDLVSDVTALIPQYAPQWTNQSPSDVGMTLVELFSWLVEGLTYRLNQVPNKNYVAFLDMLGIERLPPEPARAFLSFSASPSAVTVPQGTQAQTAATETQTPIIFETDTAVTVLPINLESALQISKVFVGNKYSNISNSFVVPPAPGATVNVQPSSSVQLCLGFDNPSTATINLMLRFFAPILEPSNTTVTWLYSQAGVQPESWTSLSVPATADGTNGLTQDGTVALTVPGDWASQTPSADWSDPPASSTDTETSGYYWIGLRIANLSASDTLALGINWILFNAVSSYSALTITAPESLGNGTGLAFQMCSLANGPLYEIPDSSTPNADLVVQVDGITWSQVDEYFPEGPGQYYRVDPIASTIMFGNYSSLTNTGHGSVPQTSDAIVATTYRYVEAGSTANVGAATITTMRTPVAGITAVSNLFAAYGGSDEQSVSDAMRRGPEMLRNRGRAVTVEDYNYLAMQASTQLASASALAPTTAYGSGLWAGLDRSPGHVNVLILPAVGPAVSAAPQPTPELIQLVQSYLDGRRDLTASLFVGGQNYVEIDVAVTAAAWPAAITSGLIASPTEMQTNIENAIQLYFHPVVGGSNGTGWAVGQSVYIGDLYQFIAPPENVGYISQLTVQAGTNLYQGSRPAGLAGPAGAWAQIADFETVCLGTTTFKLQSLTG
ncbi:MAG TPA: baseplate J/gp47 family protein [Verrucomicrobiae bacterium]|nr:baseplate J/gp47 family protein [Verrucomicrobiae bacterium]